MSVVFWDDFLNWEARRILVDRRGAHVVGTGTIEIRPAEVPAFGDDDVLVKMLYCAVCGSDLHFYQYGETEFPGVLPFILWHEPSGEVAAMV